MLFVDIKQLIFLLVLCLSPKFVLGQSRPEQKCLSKVAIQNSRSNFVYPGKNYVTIALPGVIMDSCIVSIEGRPTIKKEECNSYIITVPIDSIIDPELALIPEFLVVVKNKTGEVIGQQKFIVYNFPPPIAIFGNKYHGGELFYKKFNTQKLLNTVMDYHYTRHRYNCEVISFSLIRITKDKITTVAQNKGPYFQADVGEMVQCAEPGDTYIFSDILSKCPPSIGETLSNNLTFHISDQ